jgi:uncharacterized protein YciI
MHYLLMYEYGDDYMARRGEFRAAHLQLAWDAHHRNQLILGGILTDPIDAGVLLFQAESPSVAEEFAKSDPYVIHGLVKNWRVRPWNTVVGALAANPIRPEEL